jgi:YjbE family integral membrane protein
MESLVLLLKIMLVNIILSGDNAVVIALASRNLAPTQQKKAVLIGSAGAIILRVLLTAVAVWLLSIPYLQFVGGLMLVWIAFALLMEEDAEDGVDAHGSLFAAVKTIIIADIVMSLDNTLAIAAIANGNYLLLTIGLVMSVPLIIYGSQLIIKIMERYPVIVYAGAALIAWTAGEMVAHDQAIHEQIPEWTSSLLPPAITLTVMLGGWAYNRLRGRSPAEVLTADEHAAARLKDKIN